LKKDFYPYYFSIEEGHWWFVGRRRIIRSILDRALSPGDSPRRVLDVGCGTGATLEHLSRYGDATGVDADPSAVAFCHQRGLAQVFQAEAPLPFEDGSFDLVTALDVVEHVDDDVSLLAEIRRLLKPDGRALVTVPAFEVLWGQQDEISDHKRRYRVAQLHERALAAGLVPERTTYFNTLLFAPIAATRLARRPFPHRGPLRSDFEMTDQNGPVNRLLAKVFAFEARLLTRLDLPVGISIACVLKQHD
jgi:SAM-dependent methyltransferase